MTSGLHVGEIGNTKFLSSCSQKNHVKITWKSLFLLYLAEIRCSQKLKLNQQPMHFSSTLIHALSHAVLRENRCGKQSIDFYYRTQSLYKSHKSNPCWQARSVHAQSTWAQSALTLGVKIAKPPASFQVQGKVFLRH